MKLLRLFRIFRIRATLAAALRLMRSPRVPLALKAVALLGALLIVSPLNVLGDIPFIGIFDDVALLSLLAGWFVATATRHDTRTIEGDDLVSNVRTSSESRLQLDA